jgi:hypothetical protein
LVDLAGAQMVDGLHVVSATREHMSHGMSKHEAIERFGWRGCGQCS